MDICKNFLTRFRYPCAIKNPIDWYIFHPISFSGLDVRSHAVFGTKHQKRGCHIFGCCWPFEAGFGLNDAECEKNWIQAGIYLYLWKCNCQNPSKKTCFVRKFTFFFVIYFRATSTLLKLHQQNIHQKIRSDSDYNSAYLHFI